MIPPTSSPPLSLKYLTLTLDSLHRSSHQQFLYVSPMLCTHLYMCVIVLVHPPDATLHVSERDTYRTTLLIPPLVGNPYTQNSDDIQRLHTMLSSTLFMEPDTKVVMHPSDLTQWWRTATSPITASSTSIYLMQSPYM